jgi:hypothetical protein
LGLENNDLEVEFNFYHKDLYSRLPKPAQEKGTWFDNFNTWFNEFDMAGNLFIIWAILFIVGVFVLIIF